jgi:hypothetical protein
LPSESVDSYYNRSHELLEDLSDADEPIALKVQFINLFLPWGQNLKQFRIIFALEIYHQLGILRIGQLFLRFVGVITILLNLVLSTVILLKILLSRDLIVRHIKRK